MASIRRAHALFLFAGLLPLAAQAQDEPQLTQSPSVETPAQPVLYMFEHVQLRESAFMYDQDIQVILANPRQATDSMLRLFSKSSMRAVRMPGVSTDAVTAAVTNKVPVWLGQITIDTVRRAGYTIHIFGLPPPENPPEAYFAAIVYKDGEPLIEGQPAPSTRYITFEHTDVEGRVFALGEWDAAGQHSTLGFGDREPTVHDFIANIYAMLGIAGPQTPNLNDLLIMRWLNSYGAAWESRDADAAAALFSEGASYQETPYAEPFIGRDAIRDYWAGVTAAQSDIRFEAEILSVSGNTAVARWSSAFEAGEAPVELNGVFVLEFDGEGTVSSLREWWHARP